MLIFNLNNIKHYYSAGPRYFDFLRERKIRNIEFQLEFIFG